jgi:hypothetical protein
MFPTHRSLLLRAVGASQAYLAAGLVDLIHGCVG